jgi:outer membrane lipoprotein-sorting protein
MLFGDEERTAAARVAAADGKVRLDYETESRRWSLVDDGKRLIRLNPSRQEARILPRPAFSEDRRLAERNYAARFAGRATIAGRACDLVEVSPRGGKQPVWRLWLDRDTSLPLKRERYNIEGRRASGTEYSEVVFEATVSPETFRIPSGWTVLGDGASAARLEITELERRIGFQVKPPRYVPSSYLFVGGYLQQRRREEPETAELRYTDGLRVLSVLQRPREEGRPEVRARGREPRGFGRGGEEGEGRPGPGRGGEHERGREPRGPDRRFGAPQRGETDVMVRGSERAFRYTGKTRVIIVVGDLPSAELMRVARSVD